MHEVYLVESGAVAVLDDRGDRRPILAFALPREVCCAVPALLRQAVPWDAVAVTDAAVLAVPADVFTSVVRERWVDRWTTRTLTWLAEVGSRVAELDEPDSAAQVAALLLRSGGEFSMELCHRTIADLLDLDDSTMREVLSRLEMLGAVRLSGRHISVAQPERLRDVVGIPRPS
jgi:CRP-like cAMP-binding protein